MCNDKIICYCSNVTKGEIIEAIKNGATTLQDIKDKTTACTKANCKVMNPSGK